MLYANGTNISILADNTKNNSVDIALTSFKAFFSLSTSPAMLLAPTGEILACNQSFLDMAEMPAENLINQNYFTLCQAMPAIPVFNSSEQITDNFSKSVVKVYDCNRIKQKTIHWTTLPIKTNGNLDAICLQGLETTNTPSNEENLRASIIDHLPSHHIFWKDRNSVYLGCNETMAKSLGLASKEDIIGKTDYDLPTTKEESDAYRADDKEVMDSGRAKLNIEEHQTLKDGNVRVLLTSKIPLFDKQGKVDGVLAIYSDITKQKQNEQRLIEMIEKLKQAYNSKSNFFRNVSHDINTPLSSIQQVLLSVSKGIMPEEDIPEISFAAYQSCSKLQELIKEVIDASKKEHLDSENQIAGFNVQQMLDDLKTVYTPVARHKDLYLNMSCADNVPHYLIGKHLKLRRVLMNLLGNALKFTQKGGVKVHLQLEDTETPDESCLLKFIITDTGIGIPKDKQAIIFEPYERLHPSFDGQYSGSGLGLHVVQEYIQNMGGRIHVDSRPGKGTIFTGIVPLVKMDKQTAPLVNTATPSADNNIFDSLNNSKETLKVLLVEDSELPRKMGVLVLDGVSGYQVDVAETGNEALTLSLKTHYDIIYMDIGLPDISGIETVKKIRGDNDNPNKDTFITALTAHADTDVEDECRSAGMNHVLSKPLSIEKINLIHSLQADQNNVRNKKATVDWPLWLERSLGNESLAEESFHLLVEEFENNKYDMNEAIKNNDLEKLEAITHKIKGALVYCGLPYLEKSIEAIDQAAKDKKLEAVKQGYDLVVNAITDIQENYAEWSITHPKRK